MSDHNRVNVLCVDDEPDVLDGLTLSLRRHFNVFTATSGDDGLKMLKGKDPFAVVLSDMRMPGMDGVAFLTQVRKVSPDTVRMMLTGYSDIETAISAVNEGQIFRFLTKPCAPNVLLGAFQAAAKQYRLITAERVLLEQTLHGSIKALTDILALIDPMTFGRAIRVKRHLSRLTFYLGITKSQRWHYEVAAMLAQIGCVTLPTETAEKVYNGEVLSTMEQSMVDRLPAIAEQLFAHIPRLEEVREIMINQDRRFTGKGPDSDEPVGKDIPLGARMLKIALDYDILESKGMPTMAALDTMRGRVGWYDPKLLETFAGLQGGSEKNYEIEELPLLAIRPGMNLSEDVRTESGMLLVARGTVVTIELLLRLRNFPKGQVKEPIRVVMKRQETLVT